MNPDPNGHKTFLIEDNQFWENTVVHNIHVEKERDKGTFGDRNHGHMRDGKTQISWWQ